MLKKKKSRRGENQSNCLLFPFQKKRGEQVGRHQLRGGGADYGEAFPYATCQVRGSRGRSQILTHLWVLGKNCGASGGNVNG